MSILPPEPHHRVVKMIVPYSRSSVKTDQTKAADIGSNCPANFGVLCLVAGGRGGRGGDRSRTNRMPQAHIFRKITGFDVLSSGAGARGLTGNNYPANMAVKPLNCRATCHRLPSKLARLPSERGSTPPLRWRTPRSAVVSLHIQHRSCFQVERSPTQRRE
jgi:hypothetical protein